MSERRRTREGGNREEAERRQPDGCVRTNECHECVQCISKQMCRSAVYRAARGMVVGARRLDSLTRCGAEEICVKRRSSSWYKVVGRRVPACYMCAGAKKTFRRSRPHDPPALAPWPVNSSHLSCRTCRPEEGCRRLDHARQPAGPRDKLEPHLSNLGIRVCRRASCSPPTGTGRPPAGWRHTSRGAQHVYCKPY